MRIPRVAEVSGCQVHKHSGSAPHLEDLPHPLRKSLNVSSFRTVAARMA